MDNLVTIKTFSYLNELSVIRAHLESEGIECFVPDELTTQVNPFYSNAIGGIRLQVKESDAAAAIELLKEAGMMPDKNPQQPKLYDQLDVMTDKIPFLENLPFDKKLIITGVILVALIAVLTYWLFSF